MQLLNGGRRALVRLIATVALGLGLLVLVNSSDIARLVRLTLVCVVNATALAIESTLGHVAAS